MTAIALKKIFSEFREMVVVGVPAFGADRVFLESLGMPSGLALSELEVINLFRNARFLHENFAVVLPESWCLHGESHSGFRLERPASWLLDDGDIIGGRDLPRLPCSIIHRDISRGLPSELPMLTHAENWSG